MCGIHVVIAHSSSHPDGNEDAISADLRRCLCNRGPDHFGQVRRIWKGPIGHFELIFTSTVLSLRGDQIAKQPLVEKTTGSVLCWNGEAWSIRGEDVQGNDAEAVLQRLTDGGRAKDAAAAEAACLRTLREIEGPFACVYYCEPAGKVFFALDRLARRSLLYRQDGAGRITLSSVADSADPDWREVGGEVIGVVDLNTPSEAWASTVSMVEYLEENDTNRDFVSSIGPFNMAVPNAEVPPLSLTSPSVHQLREQLQHSLHKRLLNVPRPPACTTCEFSEHDDTRIAVLFSGGLDCTVLARMAHDILPADQAIDLLSVAFENPRVAKARANGNTANGGSDGLDIFEACPDRVTGRRSFAELQENCPGRIFRFVAINVPYAENLEQRQQIISLMFPHDTEMDLSIASALYFSSRGSGTCPTSSDSTEAYTTPARVLLSGLGADELFGGYSRHAVAFAPRESSRKSKADGNEETVPKREVTGYAGLAAELKLDVERLGHRNLGRDDRVMSHWGREVRFPYLDEGLVRWAMALPAWEKCDFGSPAVESETFVEPAKRILRLLAVDLGMVGVAREKKRAIQFGARTAKMESGKVKGHTAISIGEKG